MRYQLLNYSKLFINHISPQTVVLPPPAEKNDESDTADHRYSTAQRCNGGQSQEVAHRARLQLLSQDRAMSRATGHSNTKISRVYIFLCISVSYIILPSLFLVCLFPVYKTDVYMRHISPLV